MNVEPSLRVKIFADGANLQEISTMLTNPKISGFTTNPTLMRKAGIENYRLFGRQVIRIIGDKCVSFEVTSEMSDEILRQAEEISSWSPNTYVKVPIVNSNGEYLIPVIEKLTSLGIKINVTAIMSEKQIDLALLALSKSPGCFISIFAGRIADTGRDPIPYLEYAINGAKSNENCEVIWASPREVLNIYQAEGIGCHIITVTSDLIGKIPLFGKDLDEYSRETSKMFLSDAISSGLTLD